MMRAIKDYLQCLTNPTMMPMALRVALVVGSLLLLINHGSAIMSNRMSGERWLAALLTYLVPYAVNIHGQYISRPRMLPTTPSQKQLTRV